MVGVIFDSALIKGVRGKTAINYKDRHHSADIKRWNNLMNGKIHEADKSKRTTSVSKFQMLKTKMDNEFSDKQEAYQIGDILSEFKDDIKQQIVEK